MPLPFKVEELLTPDDLEEFRAWIAEKNGTRSVDDCHTWILAKGYTIGRTAVANWMQKEKEMAIQQRFSRSGELARAIRVAVDGGNFEDVATAANQQLLNVVFEQAASLEADGQLDPLDIQRMTRSLKNLTGTRGELIELRKMQAAAISEAESQVKEGKSAGDVVGTIKKALGIGQ